jgi:hypothetical protein
MQPMKHKQFEHSFEQSYPQITRWVRTHGWIEIGEDDYRRSFVRALDIGGMVWEGREQSEYATIDDMLRALEEGLAAWMREQLGEGES